ncbi:MAG: hypothetical protein ACJ72N_07590 [Labedaea sp.]|jgi:hypothetical protein
MKIHRDMNLGMLASEMGPAATREDASAMCDLLLAGDYQYTTDIPDGEWMELLDMAAKANKYLMNANNGAVQTAAQWAADGFTTENADLIEVVRNSGGDWVEA